MPLTILHSTAPDGTFSATGAQAWTAAHTVSGSISEADLSLSDTTTGNVSATAHGFAPKFPNNTTTFLRGDGTYAAPSGGSAGPTFPGGIPLTGVGYPRVKGDNLSTGDNDLYTVPAGKRVVVLAAILHNTSGGSIVWYPQIKVSGTYYRLNTNISTSTLATTGQSSICYVAEAGEIISVNTATNNGANIIMRCIEFDNSVAIYSSKLTSLSAGDNTVYTVPSSTEACILDVSFSTISGTANLFYVNSSGGTRTLTWNIVNSGGSVASTNRIQNAVSVNDNTRSSLSFAGSMTAGDFININTDAATATQLAWVTVMEIAA